MEIGDLRSRILQRVPLDVLVAEKVSLNTRSAHKVGCCPFHEERTPSFHVYGGADQHYYCFGCKAHGNAIDWVKHFLGLGYIETLRHLAERFGIEAPELSEGRSGRKQLKGLYDMMRKAQRYFQDNLLAERAKPQRDYLVERGFAADELQSLGFGLALDAPFALCDFLRRQGFRDEDLLAASLARRSAKTGRLFDFFRNRVTVPIQDREGRVIAFGGRALGGEEPKYINPTTTDLFDKSQTFFGLDKARDLMRTKGRALIVEGYMDALQLRNHGLGETVACMGTSLTAGQLKLVAGFTNRAYFIFDGDRAGREANLKAVKQALLVPQMEIKVVLLPDEAKEDPDSFIRSRGVAALEELIANARDLFEHAITVRLGRATAFEVADLVNDEFAPWLQSVQDPIQRALLTHRVAQLTGVSESLINHRIKTVGDGSTPAIRGGAALVGLVTESDAASRAARRVTERKALSNLEFDLLGHLYHGAPNELDLAMIRQFVAKEFEWDEDWAEFAEECMKTIEAGGSPGARATGDFVAALEPRVLNLIEELRDKTQAFATGPRQALVERLVRRHRLGRLKSQRELFKGQLARAGNDVVQILAEIKKITQEINILEK